MLCWSRDDGFDEIDIERYITDSSLSLSLKNCRFEKKFMSPNKPNGSILEIYCHKDRDLVPWFIDIMDVGRVFLFN